MTDERIGVLPRVTSLMAGDLIVLERDPDGVPSSVAAELDGVIGAWIPYTPTFENFTLGDGALDFAYTKIGRTVMVGGRILFGSTSVIGDSPPLSISMPVAAVSGITDWPGQAVYRDNTGTSYVGMPRFNNNSGKIVLNALNASDTYLSLASGSLSPTVPFTWAVDDSIGIFIAYRAA